MGTRISDGNLPTNRVRDNGRRAQRELSGCERDDAGGVMCCALQRLTHHPTGSTFTLFPTVREWEASIVDCRRQPEGL